MVGRLFIVWGVLTAVIGVSTLALGIGAAVLTVSTRADADVSPVAIGVTAAVLIVLAGLAMAWGVAHGVVGMLLRRQRHWSRLAAIMLGMVDLLLLPYGTALGVYALWVLLSEDTRRLFA